MNELTELLGDGWLELAMIASAVVSVCFFIFMIASATNSARKRRLERIKRVAGRAATGMPVEQMASVRRTQSNSSVDRLFMQLIPRPHLLRLRLERTGFPIKLGYYVMVMLAIAIGEGVSAYVFLGLPPLVAALLGIASGVALPHMIIGALIKRRQNKFTAEFPEGIDVIVRGLRAGLPVSESIVSVGRELTGPVAETFADVSERLILGDPVEKAVSEISGKIDTPEIKFFGISLAIQRETGGNLAETLSNLADILRRRRQMKLKIHALSSEARASAYILGCLPFVMFMLLYFMNNKYVMQLFIDPRGIIMTVIGLVMMAIGGFVMYRMVKFEI